MGAVMKPVEAELQQPVLLSPEKRQYE